MWLDLLEYTCFHYTNAWKEGDEIVEISDSISPILFIFYELQKIELQPSSFHLNLKTRKTYKQQLANANVTLQNINPLYYDNKMRYMYYVILRTWTKYGRIAKLNLQVATTSSTDFDCIVGWCKLPIGCYCGEPFFCSSKFCKSFTFWKWWLCDYTLPRWIKRVFKTPCFGCTLVDAKNCCICEAPLLGTLWFPYLVCERWTTCKTKALAFIQLFSIA